MRVSSSRCLSVASSLCRGNPELKYEVAADEDPDVPAWDDAGFELEEDFGKMAIGA
jgi:hypothetical protein